MWCKVIFGAITIARSKIEEFDQLKARIEEALKYIDPERLILAPDCGFGFLDEPKIFAKLEVLTKVANEFWILFWNKVSYETSPHFFNTSNSNDFHR